MGSDVSSTSSKCSLGETITVQFQVLILYVLCSHNVSVHPGVYVGRGFKTFDGNSWVPHSTDSRRQLKLWQLKASL